MSIFLATYKYRNLQQILFEFYHSRPIATEITGFVGAIKHNGAKFYKTPFLCVEKFDQEAIPAPQNTADMLYPDFP